MESKDRARLQLRIESIGEVGFHTRGLIEEGQRTFPCRKGGWQSLGIAPGLNLDTGQGGADLLCFDDSRSLSVDVEHVVGEPEAIGELELAQGHAFCRMDIGALHVE